MLHLGYGWLALRPSAAGLDANCAASLPPTAALHALTVGAIGTMTLAVMTRATLGHTGQALVAGPGTTAIYALITVAAVLRLCAPLAGPEGYLPVLALAGAAWSGAFGLFAVLYWPLLARRRVQPGREAEYTTGRRGVPRLSASYQPRARYRSALRATGITSG